MPADPDSIRNSGWRGPMLHRDYQYLVDAILDSPAYHGFTARSVVEDALDLFAQKLGVSLEST